MTRTILCFIGLTLLSVTGPCLLADDAGPNPIEAKLRDALRTTMLQLRDAQTQIATLQEAQTQSDKDKADLSAKIDAANAQVKSLIDQAATDKATSDKTIADLKQSQVDLVTQMVDTLSIQINGLDKPHANSKIALGKAVDTMKASNPTLTRQLDQYGTDINLWTTGYDQYVDFSTKTESERAKLAVQVITLQRVVADRETKNLELFKAGNDILDRYEKFSLGDALSAKEPFIGITRVKLDEFVQDYKDKLSVQKIAIGQPPAMEVQPSPTGTAVTTTASPSQK
jgi:hypothetical protein